ncbi:MAG: hypothetical protein D8H99_28050 [Streptococcus sp.]|nr:MAG: hypothetical protein D8H99_28050 [Streptococcus sp.]
MDEYITKPLVEIGAVLTELAVKGTVSAVNKKIRAIKNEKNIEKLRTTYDELINEVLSEREAAIQIAQVYKSELDRIVISDEDIQRLHNTIKTIITILGLQGHMTGTSSKEVDTAMLMQLENIISVDTLKTMQLLGFNYKLAIGEPLTNICANAILEWGRVKGNKKGKNNH